MKQYNTLIQYPVFVNLTGEGFIQKIAKVVAAVCLIQPISTAYLIQKTAVAFAPTVTVLVLCGDPFTFGTVPVQKPGLIREILYNCTVAITHFYKQIQTSLLYE